MFLLFSFYLLLLFYEGKKTSFDSRREVRATCLLEQDAEKQGLLMDPACLSLQGCCLISLSILVSRLGKLLQNLSMKSSKTSESKQSSLTQTIYKVCISRCVEA